MPTPLAFAMICSMIKDTLLKFGLNEKETEIYLSLLHLGNVPASLLGKRTNIPRSTAKFTCDQLVKKGLITESIKGNTSYYSAESPEKLLVHLENQKKAIVEKELKINQIISDLKNMYNPQKVFPKMQFLTNPEEVKALYLEVLNFVDRGETLYSWALVLDETQDYYGFDEIVDTFVSRRIKRNIFNKILSPRTLYSEKFKSEDPKYLRETRLVHTNLLNFSGSECFFLKDRMYSVYVEGVNTYAFMVEQRNIAQMYRAFFEVAWDFSSKN
ncbi:hypothetical protein GF354_01740 [Candidatus Peregrinibacteria bacterium]|nr:hypothetical protein [Candidatus Peregrinibacteria bacterium]